MVSIAVALRSARSLPELQAIAERCRTKITFFGTPLLFADQYNGYLSSNTLAKKLIEFSASVQIWDQQTRDQFRAVSREIDRLNLAMEQIQGAASLVTRIFIAVRKFFCREKRVCFAFLRELDSKDVAAKLKQRILANSPIEEIRGLLQQHQNVLLEKDWAELFKTAARNGMPEVLRIFNLFWPVPYDDWGQALVEAIQIRCFSSVQFLAGPEARLLPHTLTEALKAAARVDDQRFLQEVMRNRPLSPYERGAALSEALRVGVYENARFLLQGNPQLVEEDRFKAAYLAVKGSEHGILQQVLELGRLSEDCLGRLVRIAKDLESLRLLLRNGPVSVEDRGFAAISAAKKREAEIVEVLKEQGSFLPGDQRQITRILSEDAIHRQQVEAAGIVL